MSRVNQPIKIKPVPYDYFSIPDPSMINGENFTSDGPFLIVSSKPIPTCSKVYMELTLTKHITTRNIRHIPIYLGLHKEASYGILNTDVILASCYYKINPDDNRVSDFDIFEKQRGSMLYNRQKVTKLHSRIPIVKSVIGLGVDTFENKISIYCDGKLFYSFYPRIFNIDTTTSVGNRWYFAIYSNEYQSVAGMINYGRYKIQYLPEGYCTLYQHYWDHDSITPVDISSTMKVDGLPFLGTKRYDFNGKVDTFNPYATIDPITKKRKPLLEHKVPDMKTSIENSYKMITFRGGSAPDISTVNYPCPAEDTPIYLELTTKEAILSRDPTTNVLLYIGIPIEVGLTTVKNDYMTKSFRVCLYHYRGTTYKSYSVVGGVQNYYDFPPLMNSSVPVQPNTIGFVFDRKNNSIKIVTDGTLFVDIPIQGVDFSDFHEDAYIFFKSADGTYKDYQIGIVNFGEDEILYELIDPNIKTLYDYWNDSIRNYLESYPEFVCRMKVRLPVDHTHYDIKSSLYVPRTKDNCNGFEPGLNMMWDTFNVVTEQEDHINEPTLSVFDFDKLVKDDIVHYKKKTMTKDIPSKIIADGSFVFYPLLDGTVILRKDRWKDFLSKIKVVLTSFAPFKSLSYLHGVLYYTKSRLLDNILSGFVIFDDTDTIAGYPKWVTITQDSIHRAIDNTWVDKQLSWDIDPMDSSYTKDHSVDPELCLSIKPNPAIPYTDQKATITVKYKGVIIGSNYYDATAIAPRDFIHCTYTIPSSLYDPSSNHPITITLVDDPGCTFSSVFAFAHIRIFATS